MAFYYESIDLDLQKNYTHLQYDALEDLTGDQLAYTVSEQAQTMAESGQQFIEERDQLIKDVKNMCTYFYLQCCTQRDEAKLKGFPFEKIKNRFCHIIEKYQEQSSLLDSLLEQLVTPLANVVKVYVHQRVQEVLTTKSLLTVAEEFHTICDALYMIGKVRGVRHISRYFPHEVRDLEPVVFMLQRSVDVQVNAHWETKYVLLLWCSVIVLVPFDLQSIDSNLFEGVAEQISSPELSGSILLCLLNLGIHYLRSSTRLRNAGALFLSKLFSRPDVLKCNLLGLFVTWSVETVNHFQDDVVNGFFVTGILESLVEILKTGQRNELKGHLQTMVPLLATKRKGNSVINLFITKLSQRIGLVYLRPRVVSWAYRKGNQNLASTLQNQIDHSKLVTNVTVQRPSKTNENDQMLPVEVADYFGDVDQDALEAVVDNLLVALTNKDTIVRWSAAKGVGRICSRLDMEQADDIFTALLAICFSPTQGDTAWHGGCLALGELCRRGLILEERLPSVIQIVCKALVFEQNQGGYSVGVNVRDSACYVAWSAARAYDPGVLLPYLGSLSQTLVVVMLYDREVNVRRAASSTFQELVGRCPNVIPHGIEILAESDYFALALRHNSYLKVAPFVAAFKEYYPQMVDHLAFVKVQSQDKDVRLLASKALSRLVSLNIDYFVENRVFHGLLDTLQRPSVNGRHGALYALGDLLVAARGKTDQRWEDKELKDSVFLRTLTKNEKQLTKAGEHISKFKEWYQQLLLVNNLHKVPKSILNSIIEVPMYIESSKLLRGKVGEILRVAVARLIECIAMAQLEITVEQHKFYLFLIEEFLKNPLEDGQDAACKTLTALGNQYTFWDEDLAFLDLVLKELTSPNKLIIKSGYAQAVGAFAPQVISKRLTEVVKALSHVGIAKKSSQHSVYSIDPDMRKHAVRSLGTSVAKILAAKIPVDQAVIGQCLRTLIRSLQDYTMNKRGDVGLYIRENAIVAIQQILTECPAAGVQLDSDLLQGIVGSLLQQLVEKIDRVRLVAGSVLQELFKNVFPKMQGFPGIDQIAEVFSSSNLQKALAVDQDRVDQTFQSDVIEAEVKHVKLLLAQMRSTELIYQWNLPHCCYRLITPLLAIDCMTMPLVQPIRLINQLKGLCVSVGGISESVQKYSAEALVEFVVKDVENHVPKLLEAGLQLLQYYAKDERIINPLYKTLAIVLEREETHTYSGIAPYTCRLLESVHAETKSMESIRKVAESVALIVELLTINYEEIGKKCYEIMVEYLSCDFPVVRKSTADKFYLFLLSHDDALPEMDVNMQLQDYLLETDWLADQFDRPLVKLQLQQFLQ